MKSVQPPQSPSADDLPTNPVAALARDLGNFEISDCPHRDKKNHTNLWVNLPCNPSPAAEFLNPSKQLTQEQLFALAGSGTYARWITEEAAPDRMERSGQL